MRKGLSMYRLFAAIASTIGSESKVENQSVSGLRQPGIYPDSNGIFIPRKHTKKTYGAVRREAKRRRRSKHKH